MFGTGPRCGNGVTVVGDPGWWARLTGRVRLDPEHTIVLVTGFQGWLYRNAAPAVRVLLITAGFLLVYPERWSRIAGFSLIVVSMAIQLAGRRRAIA